MKHFLSSLVIYVDRSNKPSTAWQHRTGFQGGHTMTLTAQTTNERDATTTILSYIYNDIFYDFENTKDKEGAF